VAVEFYIRMAGETEAMSTGAFPELIQLAVEQGNVTPKRSRRLSTPTSSQSYIRVGGELETDHP